MSAVMERGLYGPVIGWHCGECLGQRPLEAPLNAVVKD